MKQGSKYFCSLSKFEFFSMKHGHNYKCLSLVTYRPTFLFTGHTVTDPKLVMFEQDKAELARLGINQLVCQWVQNLEGAGARSLLFLLPAFSSALLWPVVLHVLRSLRRYYRVS